MAANLATKEEFTVGWGFHLNNKNTVASQNSIGSENLTDQKMVLTPLTTLTTAPYGAQTLVLSGFQGGGGATRKTRSTSAFQTHEVCSYIRKPLKADKVCTLRLPLKKCSQRRLCHPATVSTRYTIVVALRDLKQKIDTS